MINKVSIYGFGVTGQALYEYLVSIHGQSLKIAVRDPDKNRMENVLGSQITFICVPVPVEDDNTQNLSMVMDCLERIPRGSIPVIRSTVTPGTIEKLSKMYDRPIGHLPEFLTERHSLADMFDQKNLYLGYSGSDIFGNDFDRLFPDKSITHCLPAEAESIKLIHNCFGAMKVTFFNAVFDFCGIRGIDYETVREGILSVTPHINKQHTLVPGPDGNYGYGGKCFPVNIKAMRPGSAGSLLQEWIKLTDAQNKFFRKL